jgi:hypothetical protein
MKWNLVGKLLLMGAVTSGFVYAEMTVDKSNGTLNITSDTSGKVTAKIIAPNDEVIVDVTYDGSSFSWTPSGSDGAYRYDVIIAGDYAGGSVEVINNKIQINKTEENENE